MNYYEVCPNKIVRLDSDTFTYCSKTPLLIGQIVMINIGRRQLIGVLIKKTVKPTYPTKEISAVIDKTPLPTNLVELALWLSKYYSTPLPLVLQTILTCGLQKTRRQQIEKIQIVKRDRTNIVFNEEQSNALNIISKRDYGTFLLQGVTGSGKTEVYIEIAKRSIKENRSVIVLVPEIALTSQLISEFSNHFDNLLVTHSKMTESARHVIWSEALHSDTPRIVIGPRSALFTPLRDIGVIIIDEAHEPSYKQEQSPKYSALRAATVLGRLYKAKIIFGSATPSIVDRYLADQSPNPVINLTKVAKQNSLPPFVTLVDMTKKDNFNHRFISKQLIEQITKTLKIDKQILIFHNRRGSTNNTLCQDCGWVAECPKCFLPLTLHSDNHRLLCHICGFNTTVSTCCPNCKSAEIIHKGIGTKLIESELKKLFPNANIARFDADNSEAETVNKRYDDLYNGKIDIAIGTQVIAKGLDLPNLRTVGVIQADSGLNLPDFNAKERTFQLLAQVVGRVGRNEHKTQVIVQSYQINHPSIINGVKQDYDAFYKSALQERQKSLFPPFTHLLMLTCVYKSEATAIKNAKKMASELKNQINKQVQIFGPTPAFYERKAGAYRWQLILKSPKREYLIETLKFIPPTHWQSELDPTSLL